MVHCPVHSITCDEEKQGPQKTPGTIPQAYVSRTVPPAPRDTGRPHRARPRLMLRGYLRHLNLESPLATLVLDPLLVLVVSLKLLVNMNGRRSCGLTGP